MSDALNYDEAPLCFSTIMQLFFLFFSLLPLLLSQILSSYLHLDGLPYFY